MPLDPNLKVGENEKVTLRRHHDPSRPSGWRIAYGNVGHLNEEISWRDDRFAVISGEWERSTDERFVVVGDISLTNRDELLTKIDRSLGRRASETPSDALTDLQVIASLWQLHGSQTAELLRGTYAFCVWDCDRDCSWLVRDRVGAETLYYTTEGSVRYAGARSAEVAKWTSRQIDLVAVRDYLCCAFVPGSRTMWRAIQELRPGTIIRFPDGETTTYWQVRDRVSRDHESLKHYSSRLRATLEQAVHDYLPDRRPVGVYLSGGLDSSCVAALGALLHSEPVHSYSIHFGKECPNELEFSTIVAEHCGTVHHIIEITPDSMWRLLPETMAELDDPIGDPLTVPNLILGRTAKTTVDTILNGEGGDPCFGGPKNQPMILNQLYSQRAIRGTRDSITTSYLASFQKCATDLPSLLRVDVWESVRNEPSVFDDAFNHSSSYLNNLMFINTRFKGADHILTKVNNLTRAAGLRGHSPLFDDRMVELSLEIPPEYKLEGAREKAVLKTAVADLLPPRILDRPKSGMMVPVQLWFRERWRRPAASLLLSRHSRTRQFLNEEVVRDWLNYRGDLWNRYGVKLWLLVSLELWLQAHGPD